MIIPIDRSGTHALKYEGREEKFGRDDIIPLWVADSDFASAPCVVEALIKRAQHPIYGYTLTPNSLYESYISWAYNRYGWEISADHIMTACGVVPSLYAAVLAFTNKGDKVIIQPPVYPPFAKAITDNDRIVVTNPLVYDSHNYTIDFEGLEKLMQEGAKLLLFCSPHNPVGRVWKEAELKKVITLCSTYNVILFSDEIHADIVSRGISHTPVLHMSDKCQSVVATAPSKSFNIAGLSLSLLVASSPSLLEKMRNIFSSLHLNTPSNPFSLAACEAAYTQGEQWLKLMNQLIDENEKKVRIFIERDHLPLFATKREGSYLLWIDCSGMGFTPHQMRHFFIDHAKVGFSAGLEFGKEGALFVRLNLATSPTVLEKAFDQIAHAWINR